MESGNHNQKEGQAQQPSKNGESALRTQMTPQDGTENEPNERTVPQVKKSAEVPPLTEQVMEIIRLLNEELKEGDVGYVVSGTWLEKAQKLAEKGATDEEELGPVDNTGINLVPDATTKGLKDEMNKEFIPLKPGLQFKEDYEVLPAAAWDKLVGWHGLAQGSPVITRYCHNTSQNPDMENFQYELNPPVFTLYRLPASPPSAASETSNRSPVRLLASRHESFYRFLRKAKTACGISRETNVRVWKFMGGMTTSSTLQPGVLTPADSRSASPQPSITQSIDLGKNLNISVDTFLSFQEGAQRELIDAKDETRLFKPDDPSNLGEVGLGQEGILVLEDQVPAATSSVSSADWVSTVANRSKSGALIKGARAADGSLLPGATASGRSSPTPSMMTRGRAGKGRAKGTVGLGNLGNTCYMNSALQCVRACQELTEYFLNDFYKHELNPSNPLGNHGDVAKAYANLLKEIYRNENTSSFSPRQFRQTIGKYNPQFSGYQQQDSQEFILFLLDGLQEDLNRITKKPYIEKPDSTDEMVHDHDALVKFAEENWSIYKARNDSVVTDLFAGMYKSTLKCPVCDKVSIIFDPYNNLTLQLPVEDTWAKQITFFPLHARPVHIIVEVKKTGTMEDVKSFVAHKVEVDTSRLVLAEIYNRTFYQIFSDDDSVHDVREGDVVAAYEVESKPSNLAMPDSKKNRYTSYYSARNKNDSDSDTADDPKYSEQILVPVIHRRPGIRANNRMAFGVPGFITVTPDEARSYETVLRKVWDRVSTMTTYPYLDQFNESTDTEDSDMVVMNTDDAESGSSEGKVQSSSVEGEDGMVDISMREADDAENSAPRIAYPPMAPIHRDIHPTLAAGQRLPDDLDRKFAISIYKDGNDKRVPTGLSVPGDNKNLPTLKSRRSKQKSEATKRQKKQAKIDASRKNNSLKNRIKSGGTPSPSDESDDPLTSLAVGPTTRSRTVSPRPSVVESEESDEDGIPIVKEPTNEAVSQGKLKRPLVLYSDTDTEPEDSKTAPAMAERKYITDEVSQEPLFGLGTGLAVDWNDEAYDDFFGGSADEEDKDKGMPTWDSMSTLPDPELDQKRLRRSQRKKQGVTLDECLDEFGRPEVLSENDAWYCPRCKEHRRAEKTFELWKLPDILIIHLKRFAVQGRLRDKLDVLVQFPIEGLDMTERMKGKESDGRELIYDLVGVDNHYGGLGGGHYTAYAKNFVDENWYYFDDSMTSKRSAEASITGAAYILFYRRRNGGKPLGGPNLEKMYALLESSEKADSESGSRSDSPNPFSGEGRRLGGSSRNGSSSAYRGAGAVRRTGGGGLQEDSDQEADQLPENQAMIHVTGVPSEDEAFDDAPPSYADSTGPFQMPWHSSTFSSWPAGTYSEKTLADDDDDAEASSTGANPGDDERSVGSSMQPGTPERMDEDDDDLPPLASHSDTGRRAAPSPEPSEFRVEPFDSDHGGAEDDVKMD